MSGNATLTAMAVSHADRMIVDLFQPTVSGCVWHVITYDFKNGSVIAKSSLPQGLATNSVWSRGQAWTVYGYTGAYGAATAGVESGLSAYVSGLLVARARAFACEGIASASP